MLKFVSSAIAFITASEARPVNDKIHFVQEIVRHGARAPSIESTGFTVDHSELTT
jgi:hypothetical protein